MMMLGLDLSPNRQTVFAIVHRNAVIFSCIDVGWLNRRNGLLGFAGLCTEGGSLGLNAQFCVGHSLLAVDASYFSSALKLFSPSTMLNMCALTVVEGR
jgi:hypothetical protein